MNPLLHGNSGVLSDCSSYQYGIEDFALMVPDHEINIAVERVRQKGIRLVLKVKGLRGRLSTMEPDTKEVSLVIQRC